VARGDGDKTGARHAEDRGQRRGDGGAGGQWSGGGGEGMESQARALTTRGGRGTGGVCGCGDERKKTAAGFPDPKRAAGTWEGGWGKEKNVRKNQTRCGKSGWGVAGVTRVWNTYSIPRVQNISTIGYLYSIP
jgi:hypothetical protein